MKFERKKIINLLICSLVLIACIIFDLIAKKFTVGIDMEAIPGFFKFLYTQNTGAAWSMFSGSTVALIIISVIIIALLGVYVFASKTKNALFYVSLGLIVGGAVGNLIDRIFLGYVRDFIKLEFMNFPIFNTADCFLTVGVICLVVYYLIEVIKESKKKKEKEQK